MCINQFHIEPFSLQVAAVRQIPSAWHTITCPPSNSYPSSHVIDRVWPNVVAAFPTLTAPLGTDTLFPQSE